MRVHPSVLAPRINKWQLPIAGVVGLILLIGFFSSGSKSEPAKPVEKRIDVVVVKEAVQPGQPIDKANLVLEQRPVSTLPSDVVTSFEAVTNKVAAGPIPARYPLSTAFLADPVTVSAPENNDEQATPEDPLESMLKEIEREKVSVPVTFVTDAPPRGARVAVTLTKGPGEAILVLEEAWISKSASREASILVEPNQALIIQSARSYGNFGFMILPAEGTSPYVGKGVKSEQELKLLVEGPKVIARANDEGQISGRAWVTGDETRKLTVFKDGSIKPSYGK